MLLGIEADNERRNVDDLLADANVALADEDTSVVDGLCETELVDTGLKATLQEILDLEGKNVIELHAGLVKNTDTDQTANQSIAFEETLGVLLLKSKELTTRERCKLVPVQIQTSQNLSWRRHRNAWMRKMDSPGSTTDFGQGEEHTPHLTLVAETILADELELSVPAMPRS